MELDDGKIEKTTSYTYGFENRLIKVVKQEKDEVKTITFKYDPFGRRIEKKVEEIEDGERETKTFTYVYDNEDIILEFLSEAEGGKTKPETTRYTHGPGIDEPLAIERKGETFFYHADGLGSITALTDRRQRVVESYTYDSFGNLKRKGDKVKNTFTFTGREWDRETGLYFYRARYYDPKAGRFTQEDPIGFKGGINFYAYVRNNPIGYTDPFGLQRGGGGSVRGPSPNIGPNIDPNADPGPLIDIPLDILHLRGGTELIREQDRKLREFENGIDCGKEVLVYICMNKDFPLGTVQIYARFRPLVNPTTVCIAERAIGCKNCCPIR